MRRIIVSFHLKKLVITVALIVVFIILLSLIILKDGNTNGNHSVIPKFGMKANDITFNDSNGGGPKIKVYIAKEDKIVEMNLEEYVRGVVAAEMPAEFNIEALKAQAVAARTFAAAHMESLGGTKYKDAKGADLVDTVQCQVYINKEDRLNSWPNKTKGEYWNKITEAVEKTKGEVLTYEGKLVMEPYYFAVSSGKTESSVDAFAQDIGYLKSVSSPGEENAPKFNSTVTIKNIDFAKTINNSNASAKVSSKTLKKQVVILSTSSAGAVKKIKIGGNTITGAQFRTLFGLNSNNFTFDFRKDDVVISCKGYGHGVGMSQWGANYMAKSGSDYSKILAHYYQGIKIEKIK